MITVDEYDASVSSALHEGATEFRKYLKEKSSVYHRFFSRLKELIQFPRNYVLIVGLSPLAIADFTSGLNIVTDLTWKRSCQDVCGLTEEDIRPVLKAMGDSHQWNDEKVEQVFNRMKELYVGYHFGGETDMFNSGQVITCLRHLMEYGEFLDTPVDMNTNLSGSILQFLSLSNNPQLQIILMNFLSEKLIPFQLRLTFEISTLRDELVAGNTDALISLMVYYGALTVVKENEVRD